MLGDMEIYILSDPDHVSGLSWILWSKDQRAQLCQRITGIDRWVSLGGAEQPTAALAGGLTGFVLGSGGGSGSLLKYSSSDPLFRWSAQSH